MHTWIIRVVHIHPMNVFHIEWNVEEQTHMDTPRHISHGVMDDAQNDLCHTYKRDECLSYRVGCWRATHMNIPRHISHGVMDGAHTWMICVIHMSTINVYHIESNIEGQTHMNTPCRTSHGVMDGAHTWMIRVIRMSAINVFHIEWNAEEQTHMNTPRHTYDQVLSHVWMNHFIHMSAINVFDIEWDVEEQLIWTRLVTRMIKSCRMYEWITSYIGAPSGSLMLGWEDILDEPDSIHVFSYPPIMHTHLWQIWIQIYIYVHTQILTNPTTPSPAYSFDRFGYTCMNAYIWKEALPINPYPTPISDKSGYTYIHVYI